jgi:hypothetical protein
LPARLGGGTWFLSDSQFLTLSCMKRTGVFLTLLLAGLWSLGFSAPALDRLGEGAGMLGAHDLGGCNAAVGASGACLEDELPWSVVDAVLREVEQETHYTYSELVEWYSDALLTVEQSGSSYVVSIYDGGDLIDVVIIDGL